jgi:hypothetical protein
MTADSAAEAMFRAIDWDFVELFHDPEDGGGYYSPRQFCELLAARIAETDGAS